MRLEAMQPDREQENGVPSPKIVSSPYFILQEKKMKVEEGTRFVGIDLGKKGYVLRLIDSNGKITGWEGTNNKAGREELYIRLRDTDKVAVEACNMAFIMNKEFKEKTGSEFYILNPNKLPQIFITDKKTDKEDALKLAKELRDKPEEDLPRVFAPTEEMKEMRKVISEYKETVKLHTQKINRLHAVYEHCGITDLKRSDLKTKTNRENRIELLTGYEKEEAGRLMQLIDLIEEQKKELEDKIKKAEKENEKVKTVEQVPGVGKITAYAFVASIGEASRFLNVTQISSFLGFVPKIDCSSTTNRYGHITKRGNAYLRGLLVQGTWTLVNSKNGGYLQEKYRYLVLRGMSKKKAIVAIARKMAELMFTLLKNNSTYERRKFIPPALTAKSLASEALCTVSDQEFKDWSNFSLVTLLIKSQDSELGSESVRP